MLPDSMRRYNICSRPPYGIDIVLGRIVSWLKDGVWLGVWISFISCKKMGFGALFLFGFFEELTWRECGRGCGIIMVRSFGSSTQLRHVNLGRLENLGFY